jgi:hypothetical protein
LHYASLHFIRLLAKKWGCVNPSIQMLATQGHALKAVMPKDGFSKLPVQKNDWVYGAVKESARHLTHPGAWA